MKPPSQKDSAAGKQLEAGNIDEELEEVDKRYNRLKQLMKESLGD